MSMVVLTTCMSESYMCSACGGQKRVVDPLCPGWDRFFFFFFVYWIQVRVILEEKCQWRICLHQIACRQDCSAFS